MTPDESDLLELQTRLRADFDGSERRRLEQQFQELHGSIKRKLDAGATPAEFNRLNGMLDAAQAASEVVGLVWRRFHPGAGAR